MSDPPAWAQRMRQARHQQDARWSQLRAVTALTQKAAEYKLAIPSRESLLRMLKGWERGDHEPNDFYRSLWSIVYSVPERVLFAELTPSTLSVLGLGLVAVEADHGAGDERDTKERRQVLLGGTLLGALAFTGPAGAYRVGIGEAREVARAARSLQRWDRQFGGWIPYQAALGYVDSALRLVKGSYTEKVAAVLLPAVADLCAVTGWIAYDVGRTQNALEYFSMGVQIAQQGSDAALAGKLLCDMARVNADLGNPMQSVELLGLADYMLTKAPPAVQAKIHSMEAKTYAILGNAEKCERALAKAENQLEQAPRGDEPAWIGYFDVAQFAGVVGSCYRDLAHGDPRSALRAEAQILKALQARSEEQIRNRALDHTNLATARLCRRDLDGMCDEGNKAIDIAVALRSHRVSYRLRSLATGAIRYERTSRAVAHLRERIRYLPQT